MERSLVMSSETPVHRIILQNCTLLDGTSPDLREGQHVLVEGERIREVSDRPLAASDAQVINLKGKTLLPGLIDAHVHLIATTLNLGQLEREPVTLTTARARLIAEGMLQRGFTTVRDASGADWGLAAAIEHGLIDGPRVFYAGRALSQTGGHGDFRLRTWEADHCAGCMAGTQFCVIADGVPAVQKAAR
jgi:imidazolonepropionase-like amidohydrolase